MRDQDKLQSEGEDLAELSSCLNHILHIQDLEQKRQHDELLSKLIKISKYSFRRDWFLEKAELKGGELQQDAEEGNAKGKWAEHLEYHL